VSRFCTFCIGLVLTALFTGRAGAEEKLSASKTDTLSLQSNYWALYPRRADISLRTFRQLKGEPGIVLSLRTDVKDFSHYLYTFKRDSLPAEVPLESRDGEIAVRFAKRDEPKSQRILTEIRAMSRSGEKTRPYGVEIGYYPKELYAASGQTSASWLVVQNTDLTLADSAVDDWVLEPPTAADRAYAQKRWGDLIKGYKTDYEKAQAVAKALIKIIKPHGGVPSDSMLNASGFEQLARVEAGKDHAWCSNFADIFTKACTSLGIPVREINMQYFWSSEGENSFEIAEGHRTTELFDRDLNRWVWIDLTFSILGARIGDQDPVSMWELVQALNDGSRIKGLKVVEYDYEKDVEKDVPALDSSQKKALLNYFRQDQQYKYVRKAAESKPAIPMP
jgi:hypothetical protein